MSRMRTWTPPAARVSKPADAAAVLQELSDTEVEAIMRHMQTRLAGQILGEFDVRAPGATTPAYALSGGNQQKFIVGREMSSKPRVLIAAHPTRGVDVGAQAAVWDQLREARRGGLAVLLVSADLEELIGLSDTLLVILRGTIAATLDPATVTPKELGSFMTGAAVAPRGAQ